MANSILSKGGMQMPQRTPMPQQNNPMQLMQQFQQFRSAFSGNPQQMVQQMMQNGQINNAQLQQAMQMAKQFKSFVK